MNTTVEEGLQLIASMKHLLNEVNGVETVIFPPFLSLVPIKEALNGTSIKLGAQNMHYQLHGAVTGEIGPSMLSEVCDFVIIGHSERRQLLREDDSMINKKIKSAQSVGLRPILCVGESLHERQSGHAKKVIKAQLESGLKDIIRPDGIAIAYEPIWAIGSGEAADPALVSEIMGTVIFEWLQRIYGQNDASQISLLYGGSVSPNNINRFIKQKHIHGALVGGASLKKDQFVDIVKIAGELHDD